MYIEYILRTHMYIHVHDHSDAFSSHQTGRSADADETQMRCRLRMQDQPGKEIPPSSMEVSSLAQIAFISCLRNLDFFLGF